MTPGDPLMRELRIQELQSFCEKLATAVEGSGIAPESLVEKFNPLISAECVECGTQISGENLFQLSKPADAPGADVVKRLRLGYCSHPGCLSYLYRLHFKAHATIDWPAILTEVEGLDSVPRKSSVRFFSVGDLKRVALALLVVVLLLIVRQWYLGGRIPILREPEKFRVDTAPEHGLPDQK